MGLRFKILLGFLTLTIMLFIAGVWSIYELNSIGSSVPKMLNENYRSIHAAKKMIESLEREDSAILLLLLGKWDEGRLILSKADSVFSEYFNLAYSNITIAGEQAHLDSIKKGYQIYKNLWQRPIVGTIKEGNINWYFQNIRPSQLSVRSSIEDFLDMNDKTMYQMATSLENRSNRAIMPGIIAIISALIFTIVFNFLVNYYVVGPILQITNRVKKFKERRTPYDVTIETKDELFNLSNEISGLCSIIDSAELKQ